jgi:hypothetical protein
MCHNPRHPVFIGSESEKACTYGQTELRHKGVKRKGSRTNRNPGTAGFSVMNQELRESACQRMATVLDEISVFSFMYLS